MEISKIILAYLVLINPLGALSIFLDLTRRYSIKERRRVAQLTSLTVFVAMVLFTLSGNALLNALGISIGSFQISGGILVFIIALSLMKGNDNPAKPQLDTHNEHYTANPPSAASIAVVPLAIPMILGPGGISTVVIYASSAHSYQAYTALCAAALAISLICYLTLMAGARISKWLGDTGLTILNRIMGILLAAVAVEIIVNGLRTIFPNLNL